MLVKAPAGLKSASFERAACARNRYAAKCAVLTAVMATTTLLIPASAQTGSTAQARPTQSEIDNQTARVRQFPRDAQAHFQLGELYRRSGKLKDASVAFVEATSLDPSLYVAYHQMTLTHPDQEQVDSSIDRLKKLKEQKPKDLLLRVALSELLELKKDFYHAARTLVDLLYQNDVPEKFVPKVNSRIRLLLGKAREQQTTERAHGDEEELEILPPPLPESSLRRNLHASKIREPKVMPGVGHAPLLP